tara:strand:+ start:7054 stop:7173 length:120 start_codon:yes stop_codon:yes gene_type:complete
VSVAGEALFQGDGLAVRDADRLTVSATKDAEILLFDIAA